MSGVLPRIDFVQAPDGASDLVVVAHGGDEQSSSPAADWRPALLRVLRFAEVAREVVPKAAVGIARYRVSGWNGPVADPAVDLHAILEQQRAAFARVALIGHSLGARAVLRCSGHPGVVGSLALSPWVPDDEPPLASRQPPVVLVTGTSDSTTPASESRRFVAASRIAGAQVGYIEIDGGGHSFLTRSREANELVRGFLRHALGGGDPYIAGLLSSDPARAADQPPRVDSVYRWVEGIAEVGRAIVKVSRMRPTPD